MRFGRRVDADVRIYVQEVRAVHTAASDGGMRVAVLLPGMRRACPPCPPDRARLPHHVGRRASDQRKVRAHDGWIARRGKIARSRMQLLRRPGCQDGETCQGESVSAGLTDLALRDPGEFPSSRPDFLTQVRGTRCGAQCTGRHVGAVTAEWRRATALAASSGKPHVSPLAVVRLLYPACQYPDARSTRPRACSPAATGFGVFLFSARSRSGALGVMLSARPV
jgi:hypothetical protein